MSNASGIPLSDALKESFAQANDAGEKRWIKVSIVNEELVESGSGTQSDSAETDFQAAVDSFEDDIPCYVTFRNGDKTDRQSWILLAWVPTTSTVKNRMLYASTREILKRDLGSSAFTGEYFADTRAEFTYAAVTGHLTRERDAQPLTEAEVIRKHEAMLEASEGAGENRGVGNVAFPFSSGSQAALDKIKSGSQNYAKLALDFEKESVELIEEKNVTVAGLGQAASGDTPSFLLYQHNEGDKPLLLVYYCPDSAPIRQKMMSSTCKSTLRDNLSNMGLEVTNNLEVRDPADATEAVISAELTPKKAESTAKTFSKPSRPGRGSARLNRKK